MPLVKKEKISSQDLVKFGDRNLNFISVESPPKKQERSRLPKYQSQSKEG